MDGPRPLDWSCGASSRTPLSEIKMEEIPFRAYLRRSSLCCQVGTAIELQTGDAKGK